MSYHPGQSLIKEKETERTHILFMASESQKKKIQKLIDTEKPKTKRLLLSYFKCHLLTHGLIEDTWVLTRKGPTPLPVGQSDANIEPSDLSPCPTVS
jgi:hypothetical protein